MERKANEIDVLIVGAGPVGLFLANECARRRLSFRIMEQNASQSEHSKALAIFPRTLEVFDMAGLAAPFLEAANRVTSVAVVTQDRTLARMRFQPEGSPYSFVAMVPQNVTESLLVQELVRRGGGVEYNTQFVSAEQRDDGVCVTAQHGGGQFQILASFVAGCDGAHSQVRQALNLPLEGGDYSALFLLADVEMVTSLPPWELQLCPSEFGPVAIFPLCADRRRIVATVNERQGETPSLGLVREILAQRAPRGIEARAIHWSTYFRIHHRHTARLQAGRMFLAGDAAHIHSPFGGQGMNTGLQDIWNLVWKLDLVVRGHGNQQLLDSYSVERLPVIKSVIETTDFLTKAMGTPNRLVQTLRDALIPMVSRLAPIQHAFVQRLSELGVAYHGSPIVEGPGERYFDDSMRGGAGIGGRFLLLAGAEGDSLAFEAAWQLSQSYREVVELRSTKAPGVKLVRPDGYLAYSSAGAGNAQVWQAIRSLLARQTER